MEPLKKNTEYVSTFQVSADESNEHFYGSFKIKGGEIIGTLLNVPTSIIKKEGPFKTPSNEIIENVICLFREKDKRVDTLGQLLNFRITGWSQTMGGNLHCTFYAESVLIGSQVIEKPHEHKFFKFSIEMPILNKWNKTQKFDMKKGEGSYTVTAKYEDKIYIYNDKNREVYYDSFLNIQSGKIGDEYKLEFKKRIHLEYDKGETIDHVWKEVEWIRILFSLFSNYSVPIITILVDSQYYLIFSDNRNIEEKSNGTYVLFESDLVKTTPKILQNWFEMDNELKSFVTRYAGLLHNYELYTYLAFSELVNLLEKFSKIENTEPEELIENSTLKRHLKNVTNGESRSYFKGKLTKISKTFLANKLLGILNKRQFVPELVTNDLKKYCIRIANTRHWYTHQNKEPKEIISEDDLGKYERNLRLVVYILILIKIGISEEIILKKLRPKYDYVFIEYIEEK